jgi:hypothetical protein
MAEFGRTDVQLLSERDCRNWAAKIFREFSGTRANNAVMVLHNVPEVDSPPVSDAFCMMKHSNGVGKTGRGNLTVLLSAGSIIAFIVGSAVAYVAIQAIAASQP